MPEHRVHRRTYTLSYIRDIMSDSWKNPCYTSIFDSCIVCSNTQSVHEKCPPHEMTQLSSFTRYALQSPGLLLVQQSLRTEEASASDRPWFHVLPLAHHVLSWDYFELGYHYSTPPDSTNNHDIIVRLLHYT